MAMRWQIMLALLLLAILSCAAQSTEDENNKRMRDLSNKENVGGLAGWAQMGRGILNTALRGYPTAAFSQDSNTGDLSFDFKALAMWMIGPFVLLAICLLFAFITLCFVCPCFYCCRSCGNCGGSEPKPGGYSREEVIKALVVLAIGVALVLIGFIIGLVSNSLVDQGVSDMEFSVTETIGDVLALPSQFQTTFGSIVTNINGTVEEIIVLIRAVPSSIVGSDGDLTYLVHNTTRYLREIQGVFEILLLKGTEINGSVYNIIHSYEVLKPKTDDINERVLALASPQEYQNSGEYYAVNMTCLGLDNFVPIIVLNVTGLFPDFLSLLDDISGIDLNDTANSVDDQFASITANVTDMIDTQFANVRSQVNNFVDQAQGVIDDQLNGTFSDVLDQIKNVQSTIQAGVDQYVTPNNRWRFIIMAVLFALNGLAALICLIGFFFKISPVMTCSSVISFFLVFLFWILCALHLIVAAPTGKLCDIYYKREILEAIPPGLLDGVLGTGGNRKRDFFDFSNLTIMQPQSAEFYVDLFYDGLDTCHNGGNLIEFLNLTDALQLRQFVDEFLNSTDLNALVDQVNISSFVGNVDFTSGLNLTQVTGYLAYLNEDYVVYVNILEGIAFKPVVQAINNNTLLLDTFKDDTALIASCLSSGSNVSDPNAAANAISTELNSIYTAILNINASDVHDISTNITTLRNQLISFSVFANSTVNLTMEVITFVEGIANQLITIGNKFVFTVTNHTIPVGLNMVRQLADEIEDSVIGFANCTWVADDVLGIINSFCVSTVGGLDTVWITCGYLGLVLFVMIAGITLVAKRKVRSDALDQEHPMDDDFYDNRNNMELPPIYSEATEKA